MQEDFRDLVHRAWQRFLKALERRRAEKKRARFWKELHEGEREAEAKSLD